MLRDMLGSVLIRFDLTLNGVVIGLEYADISKLHSFSLTSETLTVRLTFLYRNFILEDLDNKLSLDVNSSADTSMSFSGLSQSRSVRSGCCQLDSSNRGQRTGR